MRESKEPYIAAWFFMRFGSRVAEVKVYIVKYKHIVKTTTKEVKETRVWRGEGNVADQLIDHRQEEGDEKKEEESESMWGY